MYIYINDNIYIVQIRVKLVGVQSDTNVPVMKKKRVIQNNHYIQFLVLVWFVSVHYNIINGCYFAN